MAEGEVQRGGYLHQELTDRIIKCAITVHDELGPGLLEAMYEEAMTIEMGEAGLSFQRQVGLVLNFGMPSLRAGLKRIVL